ncbi:MAG: N-6 DNA methylase, partial [Mycobacterium sp.]|nr:N-6 DNA methylase [Mycobacterium sp.]
EPDAPATDCWLEKWRTSAIESGTRAMGLLRDGAKNAIEALGTGFLQHPENANLRNRIDNAELRLEDYHHALLRLVYRLIFLFVAEDRGALLDPASDPITRSRYAAYFSTGRLRNLAMRRHGTRHSDLWQTLSLVVDALGREGGCPELGLPGIGGLFDHGPADVVTGLALTNDALFEAIRQLSIVQPKGQPRHRVDYRNLGSEELGSIYESLLELVPRHDPGERRFTLESLAGNDRKTSGSYYTPTALIDLVLDEALDPLLDDAEKSDDTEAALLALTVCDPACGSGHFLVAAARRVADRLAVVRTGDVDPTPANLQAAVHDVVSRCIYGVDVNPMAAELAKVSLWIEALQPGRPLTFLDSHIKVGNSLLGTTPELLASGIPDGAFEPIEGDDRKYASALKKRNRLERDREQQDALFDSLEAEDLHRRTHPPKAVAPATLAELHVAEQRYREYQNSPEQRQARLLANAWCAAFVQRKVAGAPRITQETLDASTMPDDVVTEIDALWHHYRFFHWHLEFPEVFEAAGFSAVVGNPPWETVQMSEKEFFASRAPDIANAPNAAERKRRIQRHRSDAPHLYAEFGAESRRSQAENLLARASGRYPLCAKGKINTYSIFAEHMRTIIAPIGRMGIITPTGLATDATTAAFFADSLRHRRLAAFYDFENEAKIFAGVHHAFRFAVTCMTGGDPVDEARLAFV